MKREIKSPTSREGIWGGIKDAIMDTHATKAIKVAKNVVKDHAKVAAYYRKIDELTATEWGNLTTKELNNIAQRLNESEQFILTDSEHSQYQRLNSLATMGQKFKSEQATPEQFAAYVGVMKAQATLPPTAADIDWSSLAKTLKTSSDAFKTFDNKDSDVSYLAKTAQGTLVNDAILIPLSKAEPAQRADAFAALAKLTDSEQANLLASETGQTFGGKVGGRPETLADSMAHTLVSSAAKNWSKNEATANRSDIDNLLNEIKGLSKKARDDLVNSLAEVANPENKQSFGAKIDKNNVKEFYDTLIKSKTYSEAVKDHVRLIGRKSEPGWTLSNKYDEGDFTSLKKTLETLNEQQRSGKGNGTAQKEIINNLNKLSNSHDFVKLYDSIHALRDVAGKIVPGRDLASYHPDDRVIVVGSMDQMSRKEFVPPLKEAIRFMNENGLTTPKTPTLEEVDSAYKDRRKLVSYLRATHQEMEDIINAKEKAVGESLASGNASAAAKYLLQEKIDSSIRAVIGLNEGYGEPTSEDAPNLKTSAQKKELNKLITKLKEKFSKLETSADISTYKNQLEAEDSFKLVKKELQLPTDREGGLGRIIHEAIADTHRTNTMEKARAMSRDLFSAKASKAVERRMKKDGAMKMTMVVTESTRGDRRDARGNDPSAAGSGREFERKYSKDEDGNWRDGEREQERGRDTHATDRAIAERGRTSQHAAEAE